MLSRARALPGGEGSARRAHRRGRLRRPAGEGQAPQEGAVPGLRLRPGRHRQAAGDPRARSSETARGWSRPPGSTRRSTSSRAPTRRPRRGKVTEFVTVMKGCDNVCALLRGAAHPRPRGEPALHRGAARGGATSPRSGVREVTLIGQNVNSYRGGISLRAAAAAHAPRCRASSACASPPATRTISRTS